MLGTIISVLIFLVCFLLILVVLVQNPKGGGLASGFSGSNQMMGVRRTTDFLEKATWSMAALLLVLSVFSTTGIEKGTASATPSSSATQGRVDDFKTKTQTPNPGGQQLPNSPVPPAGGQPTPAPQPK
jgi:preprotein translocase subunit SecG